MKTTELHEQVQNELRQMLKWISVLRISPVEGNEARYRFYSGTYGFCYIDDLLKHFNNRAKSEAVTDAKVIQELKEELAKEFLPKKAMYFVDWVHENNYSRYWGNEQPNCGKWYKQYSKPDRVYYTTEELYNLYEQSSLTPQSTQP